MADSYLQEELDVLLLARRQLSDPERYSQSLYVSFPDRNGYDKSMDLAEFEQTVTPDAYVFTCAIGGVEHALFLKSKHIITEQERNKHGRDTARNLRSSTPLALYNRVMVRLNKATAEFSLKHEEECKEWSDWEPEYCEPDEWKFKHFEDPNTRISDEEESHRVVCEILDGVINDLERQIALV